MVLPRASFFRSPFSAQFVRQAGRSSRRTTGSSSWQQRAWQQGQRRGYADAHKPATKTSDLPWALGAIVVTVPSTWYVLQPSAGSHHDDHGHGKEEHAEEHKEEESKDEESEEEEKPAKEEKSSDEEKPSEEKSDEKSDEKSEDESKDKSEEKSGEDSKSEEEAEEKQEGTGKAKAPATPKGEKKIEESKGTTKKRVDSPQQTNIGEDDSASGDDKPASAKKPGDIATTTSGAQQGVSNTDTRHSTDISKDPGKSKKAEGTAETAKLKGTVDPSRPAK